MCKSFTKYCVKCIIYLNCGLLITVCLYIGNFNAGTPNYHHCLLSSNLLSVLKRREECSEISLPYANILDNFNSDFNLDFNSKCSHIWILISK